VDLKLKTRREAKPLDELLKIAEIARMTGEAVESTGPERHSSVNMFQTQEDEMGNVNVAKFERKKRQSSNSSGSKSSANSTPVP